MFPQAVITGGTLDTLLVSFAILGILLVVGTILRLYVPFIKKFFLPASLIAGIIAFCSAPVFSMSFPRTL